MQPSSLRRRFAAIVYDAFLVFAVLIVANTFFMAARGFEDIEPQNLAQQVFLTPFVIAFFVGFWAWKGRTLGMQSWGLQLQDSNGNVPGIGACTIRFFVSLLSWAVIGLGFFWQLWDRDKLTWHDRASGTFLMHYPKDRDEN